MLDYILLYFNISGMHNEQQELGALVELFNNGSPPKKMINFIIIPLIMCD